MRSYIGKGQTNVWNFVYEVGPYVLILLRAFSQTKEGMPRKTYPHINLNSNAEV